MENKISSSDERKLTNAIESAAILASNDSARDRNQLLADELKKEGVDSRFAKVASCAFNKRVTVLTFKKTADEHKADPFELTDGDKVLELMTGEALEKAAALAASDFEITVTGAPMQKAASADTPTHACFEDTVDYDRLVKHVENVMTKNAAAIYEVLQKQRDVEAVADSLKNELAEHFIKDASASYAFSSLVNHYGERFQNAIQDKLPEHTDWTKTAADAILFNDPVFDKAAKMIEMHEASENLKAVLDKYGEGLTEFCKSAAMLGDFVQKAESGFNKAAAWQDWLGGVQSAGSLMDIAAQGTLAGAGRVSDFVGSAAGTANNAFGNALSLYQAGNAAHMAPNEILDTDFLTKDRYRDRLLGWSDMTADPQFAMYPAEQVFLATQKAMDMDTTLERPDKREVLRSYVAQLLAQNNRLSTADIAALAQTLRGLTSADEHSAQQIAVKAVKGMDEVKAPEMPLLNKVVEGVKPLNFDEKLKETISDAKAMAENWAKGVDKRRDKAEKDAETERNKAADITKKQEDAAKEKERQRIAAQNARTKFLHDVLQVQLRRNSSTGEIRYVQQAGKGVTGKTYKPEEIEAILANAEKANLVPALPA